MYAGHVGIALGLRAARGVPLWALVLAAQGPDWADAAWLALGLPRNYPWWKPHAFIPMAVGTALAAGLAAAAAGRWSTPRGRAATLVAVAYLSHWPADYWTGVKPTWPRGPSVGLGLYAHPEADFALEAAVVLAGWMCWCLSVPQLRGAPRRAFVALALLVALLALQGAANLVMAAGWGPLA